MLESFLEHPVPLAARESLLTGTALEADSGSLRLSSGDSPQRRSGSVSIAAGKGGSGAAGSVSIAAGVATCKFRLAGGKLVVLWEFAATTRLLKVVACKSIVAPELTHRATSSSALGRQESARLHRLLSLPVLAAVVLVRRLSWLVARLLVQLLSAVSSAVGVGGSGILNLASASGGAGASGAVVMQSGDSNTVSGGVSVVSGDRTQSSGDIGVAAGRSDSGPSAGSGRLAGG